MSQITLDATEQSLNSVVDFVDMVLDHIECPTRARRQIHVVADEIFSNIARYAYGHDTGDATVRMGFESPNHMLVLTFEDHGKPFDPCRSDDPDTALTIEDRPVGGLGIFMVKQMMDVVEYCRRNGCNVLTLKKQL